MGRFVCMVVAVAMFVFPVAVMAKEAKLETIELEKKDYKIYDVMVHNSLHKSHRYRIDPQICLCTQIVDLGGASVVDCQKLAAYPEVKPYVEQCK